MIYCDMDGVLVDFDDSFKAKYGIYPYNMPREQLWELVISTPNYWLNLPPQKDAHILINFLEKYGFEILTGLPHYGFDKANVEKRQWIKNHIGNHINVICEGCGKIRDLYEDDAKLAEWRDLLEQKIGKKISRMQVMITVCDCKNC